jgi:hypothetical protein
MEYYNLKTSENCVTTAIYENRIKDKLFVEDFLGLNEFGNSYTLFKTYFDTIIAKGFLRVLYGDHGAYVEFLREHINWNEFECNRKNIGYYDKWYTLDGSNILLYYQTKNVKNLPNPPIGGFNGNRKEGYADYRVGRIYISVKDIKVDRF